MMCMGWDLYFSWLVWLHHLRLKSFFKSISGNLCPSPWQQDKLELVQPTWLVNQVLEEGWGRVGWCWMQVANELGDDFKHLWGTGQFPELLWKMNRLSIGEVPFKTFGGTHSIHRKPIAFHHTWNTTTNKYQATPPSSLIIMIIVIKIRPEPSMSHPHEI